MPEDNPRFAGELVEELKKQHGEVFELTASGESILARRPTRREWKRFLAWSDDPRKKPQATEQLLKDVCLAPDSAGLDALLDRLPALELVFADKVAEIAGAGPGEKKIL